MIRGSVWRHAQLALVPPRDRRRLRAQTGVPRCSQGGPLLGGASVSARREILTGRKPVALTGLSPKSALTFRWPPNGPPMSVLGSPLWRTPRATGDGGAIFRKLVLVSNTGRRCLSPYGLFHRTRSRRSCPAPPSTPKAPGKGRQSQRPRTFGPAANVPARGV